MTVKKILSGIALTFSAGVIITSSAVFFAPDYIDLNKYKQQAFDTVKKETGYEIKCENVSVKRSFLPLLKVRLYHCVVLYPNGEIFLKLKDSDVSVRVLPLLFKKLVINDIKLERPIINLYLYKDFSTSLEKYSVKNKTINTNGFIFSGIDSGVICNNYKVNIHDLSINRDFYAQGDKLALKEVEKAKKIKVVTKGELTSDKRKYIDYDLDITTGYDTETPSFSFSPFKTLYESGVKAEIYSKIKKGKNNELFGNLSVKNLSLIIDKVLIQNNNLEITFKGDELSFESVLHTSKSDTVKLNGKLQYISKKFADINVDAKNIDIEAFSKLFNKITEILNIKNPLREINIKGTLNADFNLKSDFKKLSSKGAAEIKNAVIKHNSLPYSVTDINAYADFNNNTVTIKNSSAKVNNTPVTLAGKLCADMSFNINAKSSVLDIVNVIKLFGIDKNLPVNFIKGKLSFDADIKGILNKKYETDIKAFVSDLSVVEKTKKIPVNIQQTEFLLKGDDKKYSGEISANSVETVIDKQKVKADNFKATFDEKKLVISENQITYPSKMNYGGEITDYLTAPSGMFNFNGNFPSAVIASILKNYVDIPNKTSGNIAVNGKLNFKDDIISLKAKLNADANNYISYIVIKELLNKPSTLNIDCIYSENGIILNDVSLLRNTDNKIISVSGKLNSLSNPEVENLKIKIPGLISGNSNFFGGESFALKADLTVNGKLTAPDLTGMMKIADYSIGRFSADIKNADVILTGKTIKIDAPEVFVADSILNLTADLKHDFKNVAVENIRVFAKYLDVSSLYGLINNYINPKELTKLTVKKGNFKLERVKLMSLQANDVAGNLSFNKNTLYLEDISSLAYGGKVYGDAEYNLPSRFLKIKSKVKNIDIKTSVYDLCGFEDNLSGIADADVEISLYTGADKIPLKTLSGYADFISKNGKAGTLGKFEYYLSAKNILHKGIMNATLNKLTGIISKEDTSNYREAKGRVKFKEGYIYSEGIKTVGSKISLYVTGKQNLLTGNSDLNIYGRISDEIKSKLGSFGDISISELFNSQNGKKQELLLPLPDSIINEIPVLYNKGDAMTNMFSAYISGNIKSVNSIKNFNWIVPLSSYNKTSYRVKEDEPEKEEQKNLEDDNKIENNEDEENDDMHLPDFSSIENQ